MVTTAYINIWNKRLGAIAWDAYNGLASFEYEPSFLTSNWDISPLKMPIDGAERRVFSFPELRSTTTFKGLPGLLADVLPDKYGSSLINAWLASNGLTRPSDSDYREIYLNHGRANAIRPYDNGISTEYRFYR